MPRTLYQTSTFTLAAGAEAGFQADSFLRLLSSTGAVTLVSTAANDFGRDGATFPNRFQITGPVGADGARLPIGPVRFKNGGGAPITFTVATSNNPMEDARDLAETGLTGTVTISGVSDVEGAAAEGAAPSGNPVRMAGSDGAALRTLATDTTGRERVVGAAAAGAAHAGDPVLMGGSDGTNAQRLRVDTSGRAVVTGAAASGAAVTGNPVLAAGSDGTNARSLTTDTGGRLTISSAAAAHDSAVSGNPVRTAGRALSAHYTAVSSGDTADLITDLNGRQVVAPIGLPQSQDQNRITLSTTTETTLITAVASVRHGMTVLTIANRDTAATTVDIRDTTAGTIRRTIIVPAGQTFCCDMVAGWWQAAVNTNWTAQLRAATTANAVEISVQSFRVGY